MNINYRTNNGYKTECYNYHKQLYLVES